MKPRNLFLITVGLTVLAPALAAGRVLNADGSLRHITAAARHLRQAQGLRTSMEATAHQFLKDHGAAFGVGTARGDFVPGRSRRVDGRQYVKLHQTYAGLPVFGATVSVQMDDGGEIEYVGSYVARDLHVFDAVERPSEPAVTAIDATDKARKLFESAVEITEPQLLWFAPSVLALTGKARLSWHLIVHSDDLGVNERIFIDAHTGEALHRISLTCHFLHRTVFDANNNVAWPPQFPSLPPVPSRIEGGPASNLFDVNSIFDILGDTHSFYRTKHGRNGIGGSDQPIFAVARICVGGSACPWPNASWSGLPDPPFTGIPGFEINEGILSFGDGFAKDDIVAHEFTHGVTQFESGLIYQNASGAINEAFSDIWGEFVDQVNGRGNDSAAVKWDIGEELGNGRIRNMRDPTLRSHPDRLGTNLFVAPTGSPNAGNDQGGVHSNSGVINKLCFLLTDGGTHNGYSVSGLGMDRVIALFYEVNANLLGSSADYTDLSAALHQAALNLGWNATDRANLHRATLAVEIVGNWVDRANGVASPNGCRRAGTGRGGPFPRVGQGVTALTPGDPLYVAAGSYNETLRITKPTQLRTYNGPFTIGR